MTDENIENREDSLRVYEVGYLLLPSIPEEKLASHVATLKKLVADGDGKFISEENPQIRPLAYEMVKSIGTRNEKFNSAYFGWMKFELPAESVVPLQDQLTANEAVLRFLLIKTTREATYVPRKVEQEQEESEVSPEAPGTPEVIDKKIDELVQQ